MIQLKRTCSLELAIFVAVLTGLFLSSSTTAAPDAVTFSNLSWCWVFNSASASNPSLSESDYIQLNGILNNSGAQDSFRVGVRLVSNTTPKHDWTYGGPTYLFGTAPTSRDGSAVPVIDLNRFSATPLNTDVKESFGEVQNTYIIPAGGSGAFLARLGMGRFIPTTEPVRVELYAYDAAGNTLQGSAVGVTIAYDDSKSGCDAALNSVQNVGAYFNVLAGTGPAGDRKNAEVWLNVGRPIYRSTDTNIEFEMAGMRTGPGYVESFADIVVTIIDHSIAGDPTVLSIQDVAGPVAGCKIAGIASGTGSISDSFCRQQSYYALEQTPSVNGYQYDYLADSRTTVAILPIAGNPWLISGHQYEVRLGANSGTSSHSLVGYNVDFFTYIVPTAVTLNYFTATCRPTDVLLEWETSSEVNALGFNLFRSTSPDELGTQLNSEMIPAQAPGGGGAYYNFTDAAIPENGTYYYHLQDVGTNGQTFVHDPVNTVYPCVPTAVTVSQFGSPTTDMAGMGFLIGVIGVGISVIVRVRRR